MQATLSTLNPDALVKEVFINFCFSVFQEAEQVSKDTGIVFETNVTRPNNHTIISIDCVTEFTDEQVENFNYPLLEFLKPVSNIMYADLMDLEGVDYDNHIRQEAIYNDVILYITDPVVADEVVKDLQGFQTLNVNLCY